MCTAMSPKERNTKNNHSRILYTRTCFTARVFFQNVLRLVTRQYKPLILCRHYTLHAGSHQFIFFTCKDLAASETHRRVLECEILQSLKLSNITAHDFLDDFLDGWPLEHGILEYAGLAFQSIELMFTHREHLTSTHTSVRWIPCSCIDVFRRETRFRSSKVLTCKKNKLVWTRM